MTYGIKLRNIRLTKGYSQTEIADQIGLNQSTYCRLESDKLSPKADWLMKLALLYQMEISEFFPS